jgi:hypothetical protein
MTTYWLYIAAATIQGACATVLLSVADGQAVVYATAVAGCCNFTLLTFAAFRSLRRVTSGSEAGA